MFHGMLVCFTICLFIGPDLDGNRAPRKALTLQDLPGCVCYADVTFDTFCPVFAAFAIRVGWQKSDF